MLTFVFALLLFGWANSCSWNNCPQYSDDPNIVNVHLIAHSHDDMGWIKTVDDYYTSRTKTLVNVGVEYIFGTVIQELEDDPLKRFSFCEVGFLERWLEGRSVNDSQVVLMKKLVNEGRIEFIGGGWVQPDEAALHYIDLINLYELGFKKLAKNFGKCGVANVAWQIDPFGHSREHANMAVNLGQKALFHSRIHRSDRLDRISSKSLEYIWKTSDDSDASLFGSSFYLNNYAPPENFCFDALCDDDPVIDDPKLEGYNLPMFVDMFTQSLWQANTVQRHNHLLISMGADFHYSNAKLTFTSLDRLIKGMNQKANETGYYVFYSTPACYYSTLNFSQTNFPPKSNDFFPYASGVNSYWTGYFTSKPEMKGIVRQASGFLRFAQALRALAGLSGDDVEYAEEKLQRSVALAQHHDAITGTSKENVTKDYEKRMRAGTEAKNLVKAIKILQGQSENDAVFCDPLNNLTCSIIKYSFPIAITIFSVNSQPTTSLIRILLDNSSIELQDEALQPVNFDLIKNFHTVNQFAQKNIPVPYELRFQASLPAFGHRTFFLSASSDGRAKPLLKRRTIKTKALFKRNSLFDLENKNLRLNFDEDGVLQEWVLKKQNKTFKFEQAFHFYKSYSREDDTQKSGAYIFRPDGTIPVGFDKPSHVEVVKGKTFQEIRQVIAPWESALA